jgi:hypothetical protein
MVIPLGTEISGGVSWPFPGGIVKLAGILAPVLGATGRECGTWRCRLRGTSGGGLLVAAVVVGLLDVAVTDPAEVALAPVLVDPEPEAELLAGGEDPLQDASSSDVSSSATASRGAIAPA